MQLKLINGKTLMMSSVGLKVSKTSNIVRLFHLILKIFTLQLLKSTTIWQRKYVDEERGDLFDVAIGAYDGVEVCKLVGTFLLENISEVCSKSNIGLFRDDGMMVYQFLEIKVVLN